MRWNLWRIARRALALAACAAAPGLALAQDQLDPDTYRIYGGTYMSDCAKNTSPKLTVFETALVFLDGNNRVASTGVSSSFSYFGQSEPEGFEVALIGTFPGDLQLVAIIFGDAKGGKYIGELGGDNKILDQIAPDARKLKYRRCDAASEKPSTSASAPAASDTAGASAAEEMAGASALLADPGFAASYKKALGKYSKEPWLAKLDGPSSPPQRVMVAGNPYTAFNACKDHDCQANNMVGLYSAAKKVVYGKVVVAGKSAMIGNPKPDVAREIGALWFAQWGKSAQ
ncbi:MAG: Ivy family c-type lysozyme inhibitor [Candidatus Eiseniibacteriota bacterium]